MRNTTQMLYKHSPVHQLFNELANIESEYLRPTVVYDMMRKVLEVISGKAELDMFYNSQNLWIPYLEKYYTEKQVEAFYNIIQVLEIDGLSKPKYDKYEQVKVHYDQNTFNKMTQAWALGVLTGKLFYES